MTMPEQIVLQDVCDALQGRACLYGADGMLQLVVVDHATLSDGHFVVDLRRLGLHATPDQSHRVVASVSTVRVDAVAIRVVASDSSAAEIVHAPVLVREFCEDFLSDGSIDPMPVLPERSLLPGVLPELEPVAFPKFAL